MSQSTQPVLRRDPFSLIWVLYNPDLPFEPINQNNSTAAPAADCPLCPDNAEGMRLNEVFALRSPDTGAWRVRVLTAPVELFVPHGKLEKRGEGLYDEMNAVGMHEMVVETPEHSTCMWQYHTRQLTDVIRTWCLRLAAFRENPQCKMTHVSRGFRTATPGYEIEHPQSHLVGLPIIPSNIMTELTQTMEHWMRKERCLMCDLLAQDLNGPRFVYENRYFVILCPYASTVPYELIIVPKHHGAWFHQMPEDQMPKLAEAFITGTAALNKMFPGTAFELALRQAPVRYPKKYDSRHGHITDYSHWSFRLSPILLALSNMNLRMNFRAVSIMPEMAAEHYRNAIAQIKKQQA